MPEENQNMQMTQSVSTLRDETDAFNRFKENARKRVSDERGLRRWKEMETLYEKSLTTTNENLCWQYDRACKTEELARWLRKYWLSQGKDWSNVDAVPLLNQYSALFPESWKIMYDYITQPQETDPMPYYIRLWWEQPNQEDYTANWAERVAWDVLSAFDIAGKWIREMAWWLNKATVDDEEYLKHMALEEYAWDKYWKSHPFKRVTEEERKEIERDLRIDPTILDKYMWRQRLDVWAYDTALGTAFAWLEAAAMTNPWTAGIMLGMFWAAETPYINIVPETLVTLSSALWEVPIDVIMWLSDLVWLPQVREYIESLPEDTRQEAYMLAWWWIFWRFLKSKAGRYYTWKIPSWREIKDFFKKTPQEWDNIVKDLDEYFKNKEWWESGKVVDKKTQKLLDKRLNEAWELKWWIWEPSDRQKIANAVNEIEDIDKVNTAEELSTEWDRAKQRIWEEKMDILDKNEKTYWTEDLDYLETNKAWEPVSTKPFEKALEKMIEDETNPVEKSNYETYLNKIKEWTITHRELEELIADFDKKYADSTYRENWERKPNLSARERDDLRRWMRKRSWQLADEAGVEWLSSETLSDLNKRYWDTSRASSIAKALDKKVKALQERLNNLPRYKKALKAVWYIPLRLLDVTWILDIGRALISKSWEAPKLRNAIDTEKILNDKLKSIDKINKMLDKWEWADKVIESLKDEWLVSDVVEDTEAPLE